MSQDWMQPGAPPPPPPGFGPPSPPPGGFSPYGGGYPGGGGGGVQGAFPWDERAQRGMVDALVASCKLLITDSRRAFGLLKPDGDMTGPLLFGLIIGWPVAIISQLYGLVLGSLMNPFANLGGGGEALPYQAFGGVAQVAFTAVLFPILYLIGVFICAGIFHGVLTVVKALGGSSFGFDGTVKVVCYSYVAYLANLVPLIGGLVAMVGSILLLVVGIQTVHRTTMGQAITAVLVPIALCCICLAIAFALGGAAMMAALAGASGG